MTASHLTLSAQEFASAFPFHFVLDADLRIVQLGCVLQRLCPELSGVYLDTHFLIDRPALREHSLTALGEQAGSVFMLQHRSRPLRLRGEIKVEPPFAFFLGSPWVTELAELGRLGLGLHDFAAHDAVTDLLFLLQAQKRTIADAQRLSEKLKQQQARLHEAQKEAKMAAEAAKEASRAKSEFLAVMSHEIRTPLNGVLGMLGVLLKTELTPDQQHYAETSIRSGKALLTIINDILDFSKVEARKLELERVSFNLWETVEDALQALIHEAHAKGLDLVLNIPLDVPLIALGDPGRIRQVLTNYVGNAIKFSAAGGVTVSLSLEEETASDVLVRLEVRDTGVGISQDKLAKLFQPFTQADSSTTRKYGGTGLGLAVCKRLAEMMGGEVGVSSVEGRGSTFWFSVRLGKCAEAPVHAASDLSSRVRVLIAAEPVKRAVVEHALTSWGVRTEATDSAAQAVELVTTAAARGIPYTLALIDVSRSDCGDVALQIRNADAATTLVGLDTNAERLSERAQQAGIARVLASPLRLSQLRDAAIGGEPSTGWSEASNSQPRPSNPGEHGAIAGHVLLAEDDLVNREVAVLHLESLGVTVDVVGRGDEAVEAVSKTRYDLVFMDLQMPGMDGLQATRVIREREKSTRRTPIVAWTASVMAEDRERCHSAGADGILTKPFDADELRQVLLRFLQKPSITLEPARAALPHALACAD